MITDEAQARAWIADLPQCDKMAMERLEAFVAMLAEENQRQNLVSKATMADVWRRHVVDSAQLLLHVPRETSPPWLDLGTGAGFPGLVISVLLPHSPVVMVESRARRIDWLERAKEALDLRQSRIFAGRVRKHARAQIPGYFRACFRPAGQVAGLIRAILHSRNRVAVAERRFRAA